MAMYPSTEIVQRNTFTSGIEGPAMDAEGNLYAVSLRHEKRQTIGRVTPEGKAELFIVLPEGSMGCGIRIDPRAGSMYVADFTGHNVLQVELATRTIKVYAHEDRMNQPNDLAMTKSGVLFASDPNWDASNGKLWRVDPGGVVMLLEDGMGTTNGIEVSPDERTLYVNESVQRNIWAYDLSPSYGISNKRLFHHFEDDCLLDGMRCDMDGNLYVTKFGAGVIAQISPSGQLIREIKLSGKNCTNLTFGGGDGRDCYVTISDHGNIERFQVEVPGRCWAMWNI